MKILCKNKFWELNKEYNIDKILYLLIDSPTCINNCNDFYWLNNEKLVHREYDLPALICKDGYVSWHKNSELHRENNKPTTIQQNGIKEYWFNNKFIKEEK